MDTALAVLIALVVVICVTVTLACLILAKQGDRVAADFDRYDAGVLTSIGIGGKAHRR